MPITDQENNVREQCLNDYTGELLPKHSICAAVEDELNYLNSKVLKLTSIKNIMEARHGSCAARAMLRPQIVEPGWCHVKSLEMERWMRPQPPLHL